MQRPRHLRVAAYAVLACAAAAGVAGQGVDCKPELEEVVEASGAKAYQADVPVTAAGEVRLDFSFPNDDYRSGSAVAAAGFELAFSSDGGETYLPFEPLVVNRVRVTGQVPDFPPGPGLALGVPPPVEGSVSSSGSGGDGFEPLILGRRVFNIWHHTEARLVCTEMLPKVGVAGSQVCSGYGTTSRQGYDVVIRGRVPRTSNSNVGYADALNNRIIYPGRIDGRVGFVCVEAPPDAPPSLCVASGSAAFKDSGFVDVDSTSRDIGWGYPDYAQQRLYAVSFDYNKVYCLDVSKPQDLKSCEGFPYTASFNVMRATVMPKTTRVVLARVGRAECMDSGTIPPSRCSGWPASISWPGYLYGQVLSVMDAGGVALGFCLFPHGNSDVVLCYQLADGSAAAAGSEVRLAGDKFKSVGAMLNLPARFPQQVHYHHFPVYRTRTYFSMGEFNEKQGIVCYDGKTKDFCPNFPGVVHIRRGIYGLAVDPASNGACLWALGDAGVLMSFSSADPTKPCGADKPTVKVAAPCPGAEWISVKLLYTGALDFTAAAVTVFDSQGSALQKSDLAAGEVQLPGLSTDGDTAELTFVIVFENPAADLFVVSPARPKLPFLEVRWTDCPVSVSVRGDSVIELDSDQCLTSTTTTSTTITSSTITSTSTSTTTTTTSTTTLTTVTTSSTTTTSTTTTSSSTTTTTTDKKCAFKKLEDAFRHKRGSSQGLRSAPDSLRQALAEQSASIDDLEQADDESPEIVLGQQVAALPHLPLQLALAAAAALCTMLVLHRLLRRGSRGFGAVALEDVEGASPLAAAE